MAYIDRITSKKNFPDNGMNYIVYTDGSCDNLNTKAGGSAYIVIKDGEIVKMKNHASFNTTNNRMELLAIISAVNSCPDGAFVDVYTDSQYCIMVLQKRYMPLKNADLYMLYHKYKERVADVHFHWVKGHNGNYYNEMVDKLAFDAYCELCDQYGLKKTVRR